MGLGLIFVPLTNLAMAELPMSKIAQGTGLFNLMRQLGGSVGIALSATLLQRFTAQNRAAMAADVTIYNPVLRQRLEAVTGHLMASSTPPALAQTQALAVINGQVTAQAMMLSFEHMFLLFGITMVSPVAATVLHERQEQDAGRRRGGH